MFWRSPEYLKDFLSAKIKDINLDMMKKAAFAISSMVSKAELDEGIIVPDVLNKAVAEKVAREIIR